MDLSKAFDCLAHDLLLVNLNAYGFSQHALKLICSHLSGRRQRVKVNGTFSTWCYSKIGVPQFITAQGNERCNTNNASEICGPRRLTPGLFSLYSEIILRNIDGRPGIGIGDAKINNLRYAEDIVLIAGTEEELQDLVSTINEESENMGLSLNIKRTETMVISKKRDPTTCDIKLNSKTLK